jgi:hypothetical protein
MLQDYRISLDLIQFGDGTAWSSNAFKLIVDIDHNSLKTVRIALQTIMHILYII